MEGEVSLLKRIVVDELDKIQENEEKKSKMEFISMGNEIIRLRKQAMEEIEKMQEVKLHLQKRMAEVSLRHKMEAAALRKRFMEEEERAQRLAEEEASMMSLTSESGIPSLPSESAMSSLMLDDAMLSLQPEGAVSDSAMSSLTTSNDAMPSLVSESTSPSLSLDGRPAPASAGGSSASSSQAHLARCRAAALERAAEAVEAAAERAASRTFPRVEALLAWAAVGKAKGGGKRQGREKRSKNDVPGIIDSPLDCSAIDFTSCDLDPSPLPVPDPSTPSTTTLVESNSIPSEVMDSASSECAANGSGQPDPCEVVNPSSGTSILGSDGKEAAKESEKFAELDAGSSSVRVNVPATNRKRGRGRKRR